MTPDNDIERVLDQWFAEGPMQMPGRFLDDTLGRIDREPKRRLVGLRPMVVHADPRRLAAAAAVVALLIAGIGSAVVLRTPAVGVNPSPSPSAGAFADPALLVGSWTSDGTRHVPFQNGSHTIDTIVRTDISIGETDLRWANVKTDVLSSKSVVGPDTIEFRMVSSSPPEWKCQVGDAGTPSATFVRSGRACWPANGCGPRWVTLRQAATSPGSSSRSATPVAGCRTQFRPAGTTRGSAPSASS